MIFFVPIFIILIVVVAAVFALLLGTTFFRFTTFFAAVPDRVGNDIQISNQIPPLSAPRYMVAGFVGSGAAA